MKINIEEEYKQIEAITEKLNNPDTPLAESSKLFKEAIQKIDKIKSVLEEEQALVQKIIEVD
jgi:exodeoxyribonuclease VII small subunit